MAGAGMIIAAGAALRLVAGGIAAGLVGDWYGNRKQRPPLLRSSPTMLASAQGQYDNGYHVENVRVCN